METFPEARYDFRPSKADRFRPPQPHNDGIGGDNVGEDEFGVYFVYLLSLDEDRKMNVMDITPRIVGIVSKSRLNM